jgi:hypothetical protein
MLYPYTIRTPSIHYLYTIDTLRLDLEFGNPVFVLQGQGADRKETGRREEGERTEPNKKAVPYYGTARNIFIEG